MWLLVRVLTMRPVAALPVNVWVACSTRYVSVASTRQRQRQRIKLDVRPMTLLIEYHVSVVLRHPMVMLKGLTQTHNTALDSLWVVVVQDMYLIIDLYTTITRRNILRVFTGRLMRLVNLWGQRVH